MPFLGPVAGPLLAKAGISIGSSLLGGFLSKSKPTATEQQVIKGDLESSQLARTQGKGLLGMGTGAVQPATNYWGSLLSGNRGAMTSALAPEVNQIGQGYQQAQKTSAALNPRGGPTAAAQANMPFQQQRDVSTLFQQARPQAANQLGSLGMNLLSQGTNLLQTSTSAGRNLLEQQREQKRLEAERGSKMGAGLFDILERYGFPAIDDLFANMGKGGTNTVQNIPGSIATGDAYPSGRA